MDIRLNSNAAEAVISTLGAELTSFKLKDTGTEYMWSGDAAYWTGRSPVLFPIVGAARGGELKAGGRSYGIGNHGFARRSEFEVMEQTEHTALFRLTASEQTLAAYPFRFKLELAYALNGSSLEISYRVENTDEQDIFFQLGTHPAFNCPVNGEGRFSDYVLEFEEEEDLQRLFLNPDTGLILRGRSEPAVLRSRQLPLSHELFHEGALIFRGVASKRITLKSESVPYQVSVTSENFPDLGIWQPKDAPFLCIEPWRGVADWEDASGALEEREGIVRLESGASFRSALRIELR